MSAAPTVVLRTPVAPSLRQRDVAFFAVGEHFKAHGVNVELVPQSAKLTYVAFVDRAWEERLTVPPLPYPKSEVPDEIN